LIKRKLDSQNHWKQDMSWLNKRVERLTNLFCFFVDGDSPLPSNVLLLIVRGGKQKQRAQHRGLCGNHQVVRQPDLAMSRERFSAFRTAASTMARHLWFPRNQANYTSGFAIFKTGLNVVRNVKVTLNI
jgi:hypothetical protein